jgi:hypothetical protein
MPEIKMSVETRGPLFKKPKVVVDKVTTAFLQRMVELGEQRLDSVLKPRPDPGVYLTATEANANRKESSRATTGNYRRNVSGKVQGDEGTIDDGGVVYGAWLEGTSSRNQATQFKGYAAFRKTKDWMEKQVGQERAKFEKLYAKRLNGI